MYERALKLRRRVLGDKHPDTLNSIDNLAACYEEDGDHAAAQPLFELVGHRPLRVDLGRGVVCTPISGSRSTSDPAPDLDSDPAPDLDSDLGLFLSLFLILILNQIQIM